MFLSHVCLNVSDHALSELNSMTNETVSLFLTILFYLVVYRCARIDYSALDGFCCDKRVFLFSPDVAIGFVMNLYINNNTYILRHIEFRRKYLLKINYFIQTRA